MTQSNTYHLLQIRFKEKLQIMTKQAYHIDRENMYKQLQV